MTQPVTIIMPITLNKGVSEAEFIAASHKFQIKFANKESGVIRRELVAKKDGTYIDIVQFRSEDDVGDIIEKEKTSPVCGEFFALIDSSDFDESSMEAYKTLATY